MIMRTKIKDFLKKIIFIQSIVVFTFLTLYSSVDAATYFISPSGSDSNPGTESQPWKTIERAVSSNSLSPGDVINAMAGSYHIDPNAPGGNNNCEMFPAKSGTSGNPITLKAYNNADVLLDGRFDVKSGGGTWQQDSHAGWWVISFNWASTGALNPVRWGQLWNGNKLIPSTKTGNFSPPNNGDWYNMDPGAKKIYYHPANGTNPTSMPVTYAACGFMLEFDNGVSNWVVDGIDEIAATVQAYQVHNTASYITFQNIKMSYNGNNVCAPSRDGTNGHSMGIGGGPGIIVRNSDFSQDVAELIHTDDTTSGGGHTFENNVFHDASMDSGWSSQCSAGYGKEYDQQRAGPGIIISSKNVVFKNNTVVRNNYEGVRIESDNTAGPASPDNLVVSGNVITDNVGAGIRGSCEISSNNVDIFGNYLSNNSINFTWQAQITIDGNCSNYRIHDNSIVNSRHGTISISGGSNNTQSNNCTSNCPPPSISPPPPSPTPTPTPTPSPTLKGDLNNDRIVNSLDWSMMNSKWFTGDSTADLNSDGIVNSLDFSIMNGNWLKTL